MELTSWPSPMPPLCGQTGTPYFAAMATIANSSFTPPTRAPSVRIIVTAQEHFDAKVARVRSGHAEVNGGIANVEYFEGDNLLLRFHGSGWVDLFMITK